MGIQSDMSLPEGEVHDNSISDADDRHCTSRNIALRRPHKEHLMGDGTFGLTLGLRSSTTQPRTECKRLGTRRQEHGQRGAMFASRLEPEQPSPESESVALLRIACLRHRIQFASQNARAPPMLSLGH